MIQARKHGKINVKLLVILVTAVLVLTAGAFAARHVRRLVLSVRDLAAGKAAYGNEDWAEACKHFSEYLGRNPDDVDILAKYAEAQMSVRPIEVKSIRAAIGAYRRLLMLSPTDELPYEKLAAMYAGIRNYSEFAYIARRRLEYIPDDLKAPVWLGEALILLRKPAEATDVLERFIEKLQPLSEKHEQYVQACVLMSRIAAAKDTPEATTAALGWLDRAVEYEPKSVQALVHRARFYRLMPPVPGKTEPEMLEAARGDLARADELGTTNPRIRLALSREWMEHGELDRSLAELDAVKDIDPTTVREHFFDENDWVAVKFLQAAELAIRREAETEGAALADKTLEVLTEKRHRVVVLPYAVRLYVMAGKVSDARRCLDEYLDVRRSTAARRATGRRTAYLVALVARAEDKPYSVIDVLEPTVVGDPSRPALWRLLAEAYSRTDQTRRSVRALIRYLRLRPRDPKMTLQLAKEYLKLRDWNRAFETARLAEPLDPTDIIISLLRIEASIYMAVERRYGIDKRRIEALAKELAALRRSHPNRVDIRILQAIIAVYNDRPGIAEKELKLAIKECEEPLRAEMQLIRHYYRTKRMAEAIQVSRAACERHSKVAEPWLALSGVYVGNGQYGKALAALGTGLESAEGRWEKRAVTIRLAILELLHGERSDGIRLLRELARRDKQEIRARSLLLGLREIRQDQSAARKLTEEVRQAQGTSGLLWRLYQASLWLSQDNWRAKQTSITDMLQRCIDSDPDWSAPVLVLVQMHRKLGNLGLVEEICRQALSRNPSATDVADQLVNLLEKQRRFADAQHVLKQVEANPRVASAWDVRLALRSGDFDRAIDELKLRSANNNQDADSRVLLARLIYWQSRDAKQALAYLQEAEAITSTSMAITAARVAILRAENRSEEGLKILGQQIDLAEMEQGIGDERVRQARIFGAYAMRATYLASIKKLNLAEKDYVKLATVRGHEARGYDWLGKFYADTDRVDDAISALEKGVKGYSEDPSLKRNLMVALLHRNGQGDRPQALEILSGLEKRYPNDPGLMRVRAVELLRLSTPESTQEARQLLERVVRLEPTSIPAHIELIGIVLRAGEYEYARDLAIRAIGTNSENAALIMARAVAERALNNAPMAAELAHMALRLQPDNANARDMLVVIAVDTKDRKLLKEAQSLTAKAIEQDPTDGQLQLSLAKVLAALGENQTAIANLETYCRTKEGQKSIVALLALSEFYRVRGDLDKSKQRIEQAATLEPKSLDVIRIRLAWLATAKKFDEITKLAETYLAAEKPDQGVLRAAAAVLLSSDSIQDKKEALKLYEKAVTIAPGLVDARLGLASAAYGAGDAERAVKIYEDVLEQDPDNVRALNDLAWILAERRHAYKPALKLADKGLVLAPDDRHLLDTRGVILSNLPGRLEDARRDFERLVELTPLGSPARARALLQLGRVCVKLKSSPQAKQHLRQAAEIDRKRSIFTPGQRKEIAELLEQSQG